MSLRNTIGSADFETTDFAFPQDAVYVGHNVRARTPNIEVTNKISPASCLREVCKFIADSAFIRYGVKHKKREPLE